jgi:hypothetical protein
MPGKKLASIKRPRQYEALKREGFSKKSAARISNFTLWVARTFSMVPSTGREPT